MLNKRWFLRQYQDFSQVEKLQNELQIHNSLCNILLLRGMSTYTEIRNFFHPPFPQGMFDPFLMQDMQKAVERIQTAIEKQEKLLVYGDYDVDGTTAVALVYTFFKKYFTNINFYVPNRAKEGYGISSKAVEWAAKEGFTIMIALDCGIRCHKSISLAKEHGIDVIVCDHHLPDTVLPPAFAVLNPKRKDCVYPCKELSGCGVGFKLVQAFSQKNGVALEQICSYFDFLALSIAADVVPMVSENRFFVYYGLKLINQRPRKSLELLLAKSGLARKTKPDNTENTVFNKEIHIYELIFGIAPRINAAGRINTALDAVKLLIEEDETKITELCNAIEENNKERKSLDSQTTTEAIAIFSELSDSHARKSVVVYRPHWNKGVIGIAASRLVEHFYKPTLVLTQSEGLVVGSGRSVKGFDIHHALTQCSDLLLSFGGHTAAAGLTLDPQYLDEFSEKFEEIVTQTISPHSLNPSIDIDAEITSLQDVNLTFYYILKRFAPFGPDNPSPIFMTRNVLTTKDIRLLKETHLKMRVYQENNPHVQLDVIAFGMGEYLTKIQNGTPFHICYQIGLNEWQGIKSIQLLIKDIKFDLEEIEFN